MRRQEARRSTRGRLVRCGTAVAAVGLGAVAAVVPARAHGVADSQFVAPLPLPFLLAGAGATVAATAAFLAVAGELPGYRRPVASLSGRWLPSLRTGVRVGFLALVAGAVLAGVLGRQVAATNAATVFVWPVWVKGVALVAILAGNPWRVLSPWRAVYDGLCRLEGRRIRYRPYPAWLGSWPALAGFLAVVGVVENLTSVPSSPATTAGLVAALTAVLVGGGLVFGPAWFERADPLAALYRLLARTAPLRVDRGPDGATVSICAPWQGATRPLADRALAAFVVAAVYTVSFDGFVETPEYQALLFAAREATGLGPQVSVLLYLVGFAAFLLAFAATVALAGRVGGIGDAALAFAPTVVPIAAAYEVAHNYPFVFRNLGRLPATVGVPAVDPLAWLSLPAFWASQVVLVVLGHVVAVVAAHQVAFGRVDTRRRALLAHAPLVVLMVGYTVLSLWIVSRPLVA